MRSKSSTNCLKVGLWEGTACQHSRIIMYLWQVHPESLASCPSHATPGHQSPHIPRALGGILLPHRLGIGISEAHRSWVQLAGLSMRCPSFNSLKSSSTGMPGYGEPPRVKISQRRTPKDQLQGREDRRPVTPGPLLQQPCTRPHHRWAKWGTRIRRCQRCAGGPMRGP